MSRSTNIPATARDAAHGKPVTRDGDDRSGEERGRVERTQGHADADADSDHRPGARSRRSDRDTATDARAAVGAASSNSSRCGCSRIRLKHASAVQLAPVLTNLFSGFSGRRGHGRRTRRSPERQRRIQRRRRSIPASRRATSRLATRRRTFNAPFGGRGGQRRRAVAAAIRGVQVPVSWRTLSARGGSLSNQAGDIRIIAEESTNSLLIRATESDWRSCSRSFRASICVRCRC